MRFPARSALPRRFGFVPILLANLIPLVVAKLFVEWSAYRAVHGDDPGRLARWLAGPEDAAPPLEPIRVPPADPSARVRADRTAVLLTGVLRTLAREAPFYVPSFVVAWIAGAGLLGWEEGGVVALAVTGAVAAVLLVAYDAFLGEPQWSATPRSSGTDSRIGSSGLARSR